MPNFSTCCARYRAGRLAVALLALPLASCVDLGAVRSFAKTSAATADYQAVVTDYVGSPERQKAFQPPANYPALDRDTQERQQQARSLEAAQKIVAGYLDALGDMAADELPSADKEIGDLATALTSSSFPNMNAEVATSGSEIAKILTRAVLDNWRRNKVRQVVRDANPHLQKVVAWMNQLTDAFGRSLDRDDVAADLFFSTPFFFGVTRTGEVSPSLSVDQQRLVAVVKAQYLKDKQGRQHLKAYQEALAKIGTGHAYLAAHLDQLGEAEIKQQLNQYAKDLRGLYKAFTELK